MNPTACRSPAVWDNFLVLGLNTRVCVASFWASVADSEPPWQANEVGDLRASLQGPLPLFARKLYWFGAKHFHEFDELVQISWMTVFYSAHSSGYFCHDVFL